jgi:hypothetical protein
LALAPADSNEDGRRSRDEFRRSLARDCDTLADGTR